MRLILEDEGSQAIWAMPGLTVKGAIKDLHHFEGDVEAVAATTKQLWDKLLRSIKGCDPLRCLLAILASAPPGGQVTLDQFFATFVDQGFANVAFETMPMILSSKLKNSLINIVNDLWNDHDLEFRELAQNMEQLFARFKIMTMSDRDTTFVGGYDKDS